MTDLKELISSGVDFITLTISREEIVNQNYYPSLSVLLQLASDKEIACFFRERVDICFDGFDNHVEELWEIPEVRNFVIELDSKFPFWTYFLSKNGHGLFVVLKCFLLPFLRPEAEKSINGPRLQAYLEQKAFPSMNYLCDLTGISEEENIDMTNRLVRYINKQQN